MLTKMTGFYKSAYNRSNFGYSNAILEQEMENIDDFKQEMENDDDI